MRGKNICRSFHRNCRRSSINTKRRTSNSEVECPRTVQRQFRGRWVREIFDAHSATHEIISPMNFLEHIFNNLESSGSRPVLQEPHESGLVVATGAELRAQIEIARAFFRSVGLQKGDRCVLLAPNSIRWVAADMALMAEGVIAVPLNTRQTPAELVVMIRDADPKLICTGDTPLAEAMRAEFPSNPRIVLFDEISSANAAGKSSPP